MAIVRLANLNDVHRIQELNNFLFLEEFDKYDTTLKTGWSLSKEAQEFYLDRISKDSGCAFVLVEDDVIIGYLVGCLTDDEFYRNVEVFAELDDMFILSDFRANGFGSLLFSAFKDWCNSKNVERVKVLVTAKNLGAIGFYKKKGFQDYNVTLELDLR